MKEAVTAENSDTCFYFYQLINGENLYLHPLCLDIIKYDRKLKQEKQAQANTITTNGAEESKDFLDEVIELPMVISGRVMEMTQGGMNF